MSDFLVEFGRRIKALRQEHQLTQTDLAEKVGYKEKSSIARIERGEVDIPQSKIEAFAQVLHCTPAYLMGWTNEQNGHHSEKTEIVTSDPTVNRLLGYVAILNDEGKQKLLERAEELKQLPKYGERKPEEENRWQ